MRHKSDNSYNALQMEVREIEDDKILCDYFDNTEKLMKENGLMKMNLNLSKSRRWISLIIDCNLMTENEENVDNKRLLSVATVLRMTVTCILKPMFFVERLVLKIATVQQPPAVMRKINKTLYHLNNFDNE